MDTGLPKDGDQPAESVANPDDLIAVVGQRVRALRLYRSMSRRVLSERSGVSQRYLAQLEQGEGNISIALLHKVATALDERIDWFVRDEAQHAVNQLPDLVRLYASAPASTKRKVLELLKPEEQIAQKGARIALIGLRGAGKSTLGALAAKELDVPFVELNDLIEQANGMSVHETFALYGQEGYRLLEREALEKLAANENGIVLAVAGGIVSEPETYEFLLSHYHSIWLKAAPEEHMERVRAQGDERPMAGNPAAFDELKKILVSREALYGRADVAVDTSGRTLSESLSDVLRAISDNGFLALDRERA
ncbi:MAG: helix-turn-helix transcriptional regulator [Pseudomonadota bacterium]